jgi:hypothetical protein
MYARSTTIQGQPSSIDAGIAHTRDVRSTHVRYFHADLPGSAGRDYLPISGQCPFILKIRRPIHTLQGGWPTIPKRMSAEEIAAL